jgi:tol-pal system protein YbgF
VRALSLAVALGVAAPSLAACGGPLTKARADNQRLAATVDSLRADLRSERRKRRDLENQIALLEDRLETATLRPRGDAPPTLPVEVLSPDDVPEDGRLVGTSDDGTQIVYADAANEPPVIVESDEARPRERAAPPARTTRADLRNLPTSSELGTTDRVAPIPRSSARSSPPAAGGDLALDLYRRGTAALRSREHAAAITAFRDLIARYPRHEYADNAQYWLGEAYYDQRDYARAIAEFRATVAHYPRGNKVPDALLKIGFSYQALGDRVKARAALEQVISIYPGSSPAAIATARLESL